MTMRPVQIQLEVFHVLVILDIMEMDSIVVVRKKKKIFFFHF